MLSRVTAKAVVPKNPVLSRALPFEGWRWAGGAPHAVQVGDLPWKPSHPVRSPLC